MQIDVITLFPDMFDVVRKNGISRIALEREAAILSCYNPRDFALDRYRSVDDRPYGGGPGMVLGPEPLGRCIDSVRQGNHGPLVYLSPQGQRLNQARVEELAQLPAIMLLCGRYEGVDERILESQVDREISIGDYILAGGELAAMVLMETVFRLLPGVLGSAESVRQDSFSAGRLDHPHYTRPETYRGMQVPGILLGGNHAEIEHWRLRKSLEKTRAQRPDLLRQRKLSAEEQQILTDLEQHDEQDDSAN